ncbi:MAG: glycine C-acetyltransferase [Alphaproteobacteria bacterium]|jgi:glycine C-acetyltransferase|nr:glycine C-acetyltransferase [Alphaproteobacteria bacterium]MDP7222780.1 glycine C-acetyltransferase [Alphaproteobacteria bacterium]
MDNAFTQHLAQEIEQIKQDGFYKAERIITTPQSAEIAVADQDHILNFCANNYLGLADNEMLTQAAIDALKTYKVGMASVRFICGTLDLHKTLEAKVASFTGKEDCILYSSCFDANTGLFETILGPEDAIISDALNHASIIDGVRLCKAQRYRYKNNDMKDLEEQLQKTDEARFRMIITDGVFSMDGYLADLPAICELAEKYDALVMVDDSHAVGFMGPHGAGTADYYGLTDKVGIITGTFGKALGGASGGYTVANKVIIDMLRQRSRPYLFSNTLAPVIAATTLAAIDLIEKDGEAMRATLQRNRDQFRTAMTKAGFDLLPGEHPIIPIMIYDGALAGRFADAMLEKGIYVVGFSYPVVPKGRARIRTQISAAHTPEQIDRAVQAFTEVGKELGVIA